MKPTNKLERKQLDNAHSKGRLTMPTFEDWKAGKRERRSAHDRADEALWLEQVAEAARRVC